ncbi:MAG: hypothetical protein JWQ87_2545 [Candidatus Sulfotelmatobacter sp.]|nr:hypothetical protein [Candidatus Sulfotelmatobacter sp.]
MPDHEEIDISGYSYDEFVSFVFDREIRAQEGRYHPWYFDVKVAFNASRLCEFYIRLFRSPDFLLRKYSRAQLEEGFWAIHGGAFDGSVQNLIWNTDVPFPSRCECLKSMSDLFKCLFATEPLETSVFMWWDSICYEWECGNNQRRDGEHVPMQNIIFEVLADLLQNDSQICQHAALHGLGHLHHPATQELVEAYLGQRPSLTQERRQYALAAARFDIL